MGVVISRYSDSVEHGGIKRGNKTVSILKGNNSALREFVKQSLSRCFRAKQEAGIACMSWESTVITDRLCEQIISDCGPFLRIQKSPYHALISEAGCSGF